MKEYKISRIIWLLCLALAMTGCSEDLASSFADDEIKPGDPIQFAPYLSGQATTRVELEGYSAASGDYDFTYYIYKKVEEVDTEVGSGASLYWPDNQIAYAFKAIAGSSTLASDQDTYEEFLLQDRLIGYGGVPTDNIDVLNYRTWVNWKTANSGETDSKKIRVYMKHQRSRITVILKAGDGVRPEELALAAATNNIAATIYSYGGSPLNISPWASEVTVDAVKYTQYTAIVEPHNYSSQDIVTINLSGQSTTFNGSYDLSTAGKHLVLTLTLTRAETFKALVTARVVDWENVDRVNVTLDDFGQTN